MKPPLSPRLLAALALASPCTAQAFDAPVEVDLTALPAVPDFGNAVAGDFTGDGLADAILLDDGLPLLVYGPSMFRWSGYTPFTAGDLARLDAIGPDGQDGLVFVDGSYVHRAVLLDETTWSVTDLGYPAFADAEKVLTGDLDLDGEQDVVALAAGAGSVLVVLGIEDEPHGAATSFSLPPGTTYDVALMDWTGSAEPEVLVAHTSGIRVYDRTGVLVDFEPKTYRDCRLHPIEENGVERLLAIYSTNEDGGTSFLWMLDETGHEPFVVVGTNEVRTAAVADVDGDGREDLVVVQENDYVPTLFLNQSTTPTFVFAASEVLTPQGSDPPEGSDTPVPLLEDFDNDGDPDLCLGFPPTSSTSYWQNASIDALDQTLHLDDAEPLLWWWDPVKDDAVLIAQVDTGYPVGGVGAHTDLEVLTYFRSSLTGVVGAAPIAKEYIDVTGGVPDEVSLPVDYVYLPNQNVDFDGDYYIYYRFVQRDVGGAVLDVAPYRSLGFAPYVTVGLYEVGVQASLSGAPILPAERVGVGPGGEPDPEPPPIEENDPPVTDPPPDTP